MNKHTWEKGLTQLPSRQGRNGGGAAGSQEDRAVNQGGGCPASAPAEQQLAAGAVPMRQGVVCRVPRVPAGVRPGAGDREERGPVLAAHRGRNDQIAVTWIRRLKGHKVG